MARNDFEHLEQVALFEWAAWVKEPLRTILDDLLYAYPAGGKRPQKIDKKGRTYSPTAARMKAEGAKDGIPDIFLAVAMNGSHGLYIEMKYGKNKPTPLQKKRMKALEEQGYDVVVCWGWIEAAKKIMKYLGLSDGVGGLFT